MPASTDVDHMLYHGVHPHRIVKVGVYQGQGYARCSCGFVCDNDADSIFDDDSAFYA